MNQDLLVQKKNPFLAFRSLVRGALMRSVAGSSLWKTIDRSDADGRLSASRSFRLFLAPESGLVPVFKPGQFVFLSFPGRGLLDSPRPFSIASSPTETRFIEILAKDTGDWSGAAKKLPLKAAARVWGPFGSFACPEAEGARLVFLAGGIGAAPFLSMVRCLADRNRTAKVLFIWGARTRDDLIGKEAVLEAGGMLEGLRFVPVLSHDPRWTGEAGRIDGEKLDRLVPAAFGSTADAFEWNSVSYRLCGPGRFSRDLRSALRDRGVRAAAIRSLSFDL